MPLFQVKFKKKLNGYELSKCREIYDVEKRSEALENVYARYGKENILDAVIEELGNNFSQVEDQKDQASSTTGGESRGHERIH